MPHSTEHQLHGKQPDRAVRKPDEDRYGFTHIARQLARAIQGIGREGNAVIGIEGAWGSGKTSLLNLLRIALDQQKEDRTFVLTISPWLDGSDTPLVASLLLPVASIIAAEEESRLSPEELAGLRQKKSLTRTARTLMEYTRATARTLAPVAQAAALIPCVPDTSDALKALSESRWLKEKEKTTTQMRADIAEKIAELDLSFIVLLDDLDRLEPDQAVEVIRLVKSVADFPRFRYLLCYDKTVLSNAISQGLGIADGSLYLQKIVQLSFSLPLPESFDLRHEFMTGAIQLYRSVNRAEPDYSLIQDLKEVTGIFGAMLRTPREVSLTLENLSFRYQSLREYVWFPDLCLLQLLHVTFPDLYHWTEFYLTEYATMASGSGEVTKKEKLSAAKALSGLLRSQPAASPLSVLELTRWLPGIEGTKDESPVLFRPVSRSDQERNDADKRLCSNVFWRYYFAFTPPKDVLLPDFFDQLFSQASRPEQKDELAERLLSMITDTRFSRRTWFEHILDRITPRMLGQTTPAACRGLLDFLFHHGNDIARRYRDRDLWHMTGEFTLKEFADRLLRRLVEDNRQAAQDVLAVALTNENTFLWATSYLRHLLWQNGLAGNRPAQRQDRVLKNDELTALRILASAWLENPDNRDIIWRQEDLSDLFYSWREISTPAALSAWLAVSTREDRDFLQVLLWLRYHGISSATGRYQGLRLSEAVDIFGTGDAVAERLNNIESAGNFPEEVKAVRDAVARDSHRF